MHARSISCAPIDVWFFEWVSEWVIYNTSDCCRWTKTSLFSSAKWNNACPTGCSIQSTNNTITIKINCKQASGRAGQTLIINYLILTSLLLPLLHLHFTYEYTYRRLLPSTHLRLDSLWGSGSSRVWDSSYSTFSLTATDRAFYHDLIFKSLLLCSLYLIHCPVCLRVKLLTGEG